MAALTVPLWAVLLVGMIVVERRHGQVGSGTAQARGTDAVMQLATVTVLVLGTCAALAVPAAALPGADFLLLLGGALAATGLALRRAAMRQLGRHFTLTPCLATEHRLITGGLYARVRHPGYLALLLYLIGLLVTLANGASLLAALPLLCCLPLRIRVEEAALAERFGADFDRYVRATPAAVVPTAAPWKGTNR